MSCYVLIHKRSIETRTRSKTYIYLKLFFCCHASSTVFFRKYKASCLSVYLLSAEHVVQTITSRTALTLGSKSLVCQGFVSWSLKSSDAENKRRIKRFQPDSPTLSLSPRLLSICQSNMPVWTDTPPTQITRCYGYVASLSACCTTPLSLSHSCVCWCVWREQDTHIHALC